MRRAAVVAGVLTALIGVTFVAGNDHPAMPGAIIRRPDALDWKDAPPSLPPGAKVAILEGDPTKAGPFVMRFKFPDGYRVMPHTHPKPERVTVLAGALHIGMGATFDAAKCQEMRVGTYGTWPAGMQHFGWFKGETILQLHGEGPWAVEYVNPADDPRIGKK
ncbi:MAG: cupin domain-containing protein [Gemmataceae bacterium]